MPASSNSRAPRSLILVIPVFNDWDAVRLLIPNLDAAAAASAWRVSVLLVDDGSTEPCPEPLLAQPPRHIDRVDVLSLRRNLGHQRAIAVGLAYVEANLAHDAVIVMDGDGEDAPSDVPRLLARFDELGGGCVVFAARMRRSEGPVFQFFYHLYRMIHRVLTGIPVRVGNFCVLPARAVHRLVIVSDLWNHFAASVFKARLPLDLLPTTRGRRLTGHRGMSFTALVVHGLSAISVFGDRVGVRGMLVAVAFLSLTIVGLASVILLRVLTDMAIPGWATSAAGLLVVVGMQLVLTMAVFAFIVLGSRDTASFLPIRDYAYFVSALVPIWSSRSAEADAALVPGSP